MITQFGTFEDGAKAGQLLIRLFRDLGTDVDRLTRPSAEELDRICQFIWSQNTIEHPYHSVRGFLSTVLRRETYCAEIMHVYGTTEIIEAQSEYAPICNLPSMSGMITFGYWTGDLSDGDSWCIDIRADRMCCVPVGGPETLAEARQSAYATFPDFHYLEAYLRRSAELRGWLPFAGTTIQP